MKGKINCKSCNTLFEGNYCNKCGEKVIYREDRTIRHFMGELFNASTFADNKLWRTIRHIVFQPGVYSLNYISGKRVKVMKPISIFFLANLLYFLIPSINTFTTPLNIQMRAFAYSPMVSKWVDDEVENRGIDFEEYELKYDAKTTELSKMLLIVMTFMFSLTFSIIHFKSKQHLLADHLAISLELMTFILLICVQLLGIIGNGLRMLGFSWLVSNQGSSIMAGVGLIYFFLFMEKNFYHFEGWRRYANILFSIAAVVLILLLYRLLLFFVTFMVV